MTEPVPDRRAATAIQRALDGSHDVSAHPPPPPPPGRRAGERALRLGTVAAVALAAALLTGRPWVLALAATPLVLLALALPGGPRPENVTAEVEVEPRRCFEGEQVTVRITLSYDGAPARLDPGVALGHRVRLDHLAVGPHRVDLVLSAQSWGRWTLGTVDVDVYDPGGLTRRTVRAELGEIAVFPLPEHAGLTPIPVRLPQRLGEHTAVQRGEGVEVTGVHPYVRGERQRRIHWPATTRRGALQVHQFAAERAADTVVLLDALADVVDPVTGTSSLDETFRAAAGLVRAYLRTHDRVGVVSVGGTTRWLQPGSGQGYFYRIVESVLEVRKDAAYRTEGLSPLPPPALPEGALVYVITPLTDRRIFDVLHQVRGRANPMVVVEIPAGEPASEPGDTEGELALRLWRADRDAMRFALVERGIAVVAHRPGETLDLTLAPLLRTRIHGGTR
ncbi:DUF58 domain-containing protein [Streptomyces acidiscabies]|uniref:DUF58 domain-containing protein n=3 Tax=Streptomyces acidiscabies TaxID=42234 RepID=A0AAP6BLY6_9ACTN|nr:DUF58 domain-containing protein [Streptomyces acidiscabies]MBP5942207.1 DUF58 domain-containing protein [Streptomyces sp. LBUM 1476]MBZ3913726.1 DUF58 domain-containing protein [Streptomyces acidiscabies]MDX2966937.1 DUF58 domain-containing protein [Streptomyces acidiscabies]MDX3022183.1 DUF58 domain-containing protein [Streptomyces acidiscabies]MDX3795446.1 DUF58 domain-containing protein [Streptomyces acidiscabies]